MPDYVTHNGLGGTQQALSTAYKTLLVMKAASGTQTRRGRIKEILIGTDGTPADQVVDWDVSRQTADGTATSVTPNALDPADAAALGISQANATAEGTITANSSVFFVGVNQRASYRWVASPGSELVYPATNLAGFALRAKSPGYTGTATGAFTFNE